VFFLTASNRLKFTFNVSSGSRKALGNITGISTVSRNCTTCNSKKFAIFSDSLSSLLAINNRHLETGYVQKLITDYSQLSNSGKIIILIWIPSHIGIRGNDLADEAAKSALNLSMSALKCSATDLYTDVANHCQRLWQAEWDGCVLNKLHSVKPLLGYSNLSSLSRQDAVVLRRLRILALPIHIC